MATLNDALDFMQDWTGCRHPEEAREALYNTPDTAFTEFVFAALNRGASLQFMQAPMNKEQNAGCQAEQFEGLSDTMRKLVLTGLSITDATSVYCAAKELNVDAHALGEFVSNMPISKKKHATITLDAETQQPVDCTKQECGMYYGDSGLMQVWKPCRYIITCTLRAHRHRCVHHQRNMIYLNVDGMPEHCTNTSCTYEGELSVLDVCSGRNAKVEQKCEYYTVCRLRHLPAHHPRREIGRKVYCMHDDRAKAAILESEQSAQEHRNSIVTNMVGIPISCIHKTCIYTVLITSDSYDRKEVQCEYYHKCALQSKHSPTRY